ncbi:hypothetical protein ACFU99_14350, partial [Streptomyces sp. NPDC057654]
LLTMAAWGNHLLEPHERGMVLVNARTGEEAEPVVVDRADGRRVDTEEFVFAAGPASSAAMRARYPRRPRPAPPGRPRRPRQETTAPPSDTSSSGDEAP